MNFKAKKSNVTKSLYIILILCIISVVCLSVYAFFVQKDALSNSNRLENNGQNASADNKNDELLRLFGTTERQTAPTQPQTERPSIPVDTEPDSRNVQQSQSQITPDEKSVGGAEEMPLPKPAEVNNEQQMAVGDNDIENSAALEVLAVPSFFQKPIAGTVAKIYNSDTPEFSVIMNDYRTHMGIDIEGDIGTNVKAVADGIVAEIVDDPMMGKTIVISHAGGIESVYMNLQEHIPQNIVIGAAVKAGDVIGGVGESSLIELSDVPHLHFAMKKDGELIDPLKYVEY